MPHLPQRQGERAGRRSRRRWGRLQEQGLCPLLHTSWPWHGGSLRLTSCCGAITISGRPRGTRPFPSEIPTERPRPGLGGEGGTRREPGTRCPHPSLISRQSCPLGGRARALDLLDLPEHTEPEPDHSHTRPAPEEGPVPGLGSPLPHTEAACVSITALSKPSPVETLTMAQPQGTQGCFLGPSLPLAGPRCEHREGKSWPTKAGRAGPLWAAFLGDPHGAT